MSSTTNLRINTPRVHEAERLANTGRNDTMPVPTVAALLYLDRLQGRPEAAQLLVTRAFAQLLLSTSYIQVKGGPLAGLRYPEILQPVADGAVDEFDIVFTRTQNLAAIVHGRKLKVRVVAGGPGVPAMQTADASGRPIE